MLEDSFALTSIVIGRPALRVGELELCMTDNPSQEPATTLHTGVYPGVGVLVSDASGVIYDVNTHLLHRLGYSYFEVVGVKSLHELLPTCRCNGRVFDLVNSCFDDTSPGVYRPMSASVVSSNGEELESTIWILPYEKEGERTTYLLLVAPKVGGRAILEFVNQDDQGILATLLEAVTFGVLLVDGHGGVLYSNVRALEILDISETRLGTMVEDLFFNLFGEGLVPLAYTDSPIYNSIQNMVPSNGSFGISTSAKVLRWLAVETVPVNLVGVGPGIVVTLVDVTTERSIRDNERLSMSRLEALIEDGWDLVITVDLDSTITWSSAACRRLLGYEKDELIGSNFLDFIHKEDLEEVTKVADVVSRSVGQRVSLTVRVSHKDGGYRHLEFSVINCYDDPSIRGVLATARDVTDKMLAEGRWKAAAETLHIGLVLMSPDGVWREVNQAVADMLGISAEFLVGADLEAFSYLHDSGLGAKEFLAVVKREKERTTFQKRLVRWEGTPFQVEVGFAGIFDPSGTLLEVVAFIEDISVRHRAQQELERAFSRFEALVEHSSDVTLIVDKVGRLLYASPGLENVLGYSNRARFGKRTADLVHPADRERVKEIFAVILSKQGCVESFDCRLFHNDGTYRYVEVTVTNLTEDRAVSGIVVNVRDVTESVVIARRLEYQASHDPLTMLPNRLLLLDRLNVARERYLREGYEFALLYLDLDEFKHVNDSMGHTVGDELLIEVARRLVRAVRSEDTVSRLGGDEFVVLAMSVGGASEARSLAERIRGYLEVPFDIGDVKLRVGCSIGITLSEGATAEEMMQEADTALYRAKERGRGRWELFDQAMRTMSQRRMEIEQLLRRSIESNNVVLVFQPIVDISSMKLSCTEALVRIRDEGINSLVGPSEFIDIAERSGLIVPIGNSVLKMTGRYVREWNQSPELHNDPMTVSVNLSPRQLSDPLLVPLVRSILSENALDPSWLCVELTEYALIDVGSSMQRSLFDLADLGIKIAIDDFGTGWSSLTYLRNFPISTLKIDRSFVEGLGKVQKDTELVKAVVGLGHSLDLETVAEGVEFENQLAILKELGCTKAQGYLISRPVDEASLFEFKQSH